jgi:hypothetical protein
MGFMKTKNVCTFMAVVSVCSGLLTGCGNDNSPAAPATTILYTSDAHYGIKRSVVANSTFGNLSSAQQVNGAMIGVMNSLQTAALPSDGGINAGQTLGAVDFVVETGDAVNRAEKTIYPRKNALAKEVWPQFAADYITALNVKDRAGNKAQFYMTPGNHDVSNAIGYWKGTLSTTAGLDATSYVEIYKVMNPTTTLTNTSFIGSPADYATAATSYLNNRLVKSKDVNGVHFVFVGMWPDSTARTLIDNDLKNVSATTPVILFTHDQPDAEAKHFSDPNNPPPSAIMANQFENLLTDTFADTLSFGTPYSDAAGTSGTVLIPSLIEQRNLVTWLKTHKNIVAYFHGNDNRNEFYTYPTTDTTSPNYLGAGYNINLNVFRVDSPMKGTISGIDAADGKGDPTKLSFQIISIDSGAKNMTVREYLWNTKTWGVSKTVSLAPRAL